MKKILGIFVGVLAGYGAWIVIKYMMLLSGPFVLGPIGITGPEAASNLEAIAEILGFLVFMLVSRKIYRSIVGKKDKPKNTSSFGQ